MNTTATAAPEPKTAVLTTIMRPQKQCKASVRYATQDPDFPIANLYVDRTFANPMPDKINVTVSANDTGHDDAIALEIGKECKNSIRYEVMAFPDKFGVNAPISKAYVSRTLANLMPQRITMTIK